MKNRCCFLLVSLLCCCLLQAQQRVDSLLTVLDRTIANTARYEQARLKRIAQIKERYHTRKSTSLAEEYRINQQLYDEYEAYICDSARHYINRNIEIARQCNEPDWLNEAKMKKANILGKTGLYAEGVALLKSIDSKRLSDEQLIEYYITFEDIYLYHAEYAMDDEYQLEYLNKLYAYRDSVLQMVDKDSYQYITTYAPELLQQGRGDDAIALLEAYHRKLSPDTRDYAVATSILAFIYQSTGQREKQKEYLIKSAIADIRGVVKENNSLRALAELLYEEGQLQRADVYMKRSMEDANFYNARLRNVQASRMLPVIDHAYQVEKEKHRQVLQVFLIVTSLLALFLAGAVWYVIRQMKKLARARLELLNMNEELTKLNEKLKKLNEKLTEVNRKQLETNDSLTEANHIKEEYVGRFMGMCSVYIDKLESYRRMLNKQAASGKVEELFKTLKSSRFIDEELKEFYQNFDNSFLNIFPDFVKRFNELLPEEERITPKQDERLTTELRIFALIRLGIADSAKIASFLRYSITTIYTYRSKMKNRSLYRDSFEEEVMKIGSFSRQLNPLINLNEI